MGNPHLAAVTRILDDHCPDATSGHRIGAAAAIATYLDQLLAGQDQALRDLNKNDGTPSGLIATNKAREAVAHAGPSFGVPRPRTTPTSPQESTR